MDADDGNKITYAEFAAWDPSIAQVTEGLGRNDAFLTPEECIQGLPIMVAMRAGIRPDL
jgi:hypothetical protein